MSCEWCEAEVDDASDMHVEMIVEQLEKLRDDIERQCVDPHNDFGDVGDVLFAVRDHRLIDRLIAVMRMTIGERR